MSQKENRKQRSLMLKAQARRRRAEKEAALNGMTPEGETSMLAPALNSLAPLELGASMASKAVAEPVAGYAGIAASLIPGGKTGPEAIESTREAMTYKPRLEATQKAEAQIAKPFGWLEGKADVAGERTTMRLIEMGVPEEAAAAIGSGAKSALLTLPMFMTRGGRLNKVLGIEKPQPIMLAEQNGYTLLPSTALEGKRVGGMTKRVAEVAGGKARTGAKISLKNQEVTNNLVKQELGIPKEASLSPALLRQAKQPWKVVRQQIENTKVAVRPDDVFVKNLKEILAEVKDEFTGQPINKSVAKSISSLMEPKNVSTKAVLKKIESLRREAKVNFRATGKKANEQRQLAYAQKQAATALEDLLERRLGPEAPDLVKQYREARVNLAKIGAIEDALKGSDVDAKVIWKERKNGGMLTGNLETIADVYEHFPNVMRTSADLGKVAELGTLDVLLGVPTLGGWPAMRVAGSGVAAMKPPNPASLAELLARGEFLSAQGSSQQ